jgi:hypothetical protein
MSTITTIAASDVISSSRAVINNNFAALNTDKVDIASTYANPPWITSIAGSKVTGDIPGGAATAARLTTPRTIAGVAFDGSANIAIASTGLSDSSALVRGAAGLSTPGHIPFVAEGGSLSAEAALRYDSASNTLTAENANIGTVPFLAAGGTSVNVYGEIRIVDNGDVVTLFGCNHADPTKRCFATDTPSDAYNRFTIDGNGLMFWGDGSAPLSKGLYRNGASMEFNTPLRISTSLTVLHASNTSYSYFGPSSAGLTQISGFRSDSPFTRAIILNPDGGNVLVGGRSDDGSNRFQVAGSAAIGGNISLAATLTLNDAATFIDTPNATSALRFSNSPGIQTQRNGSNSFSYFGTTTGGLTQISGFRSDSPFVRAILINPDGGNVVVGNNADDGSAKLQVNGVVKTTSLLFSGSTEPAANSGNEGLMVYIKGTSGVSGSLRICAQLTDGSYAWVPLF